MKIVLGHFWAKEKNKGAVKVLNSSRKDKSPLASITCESAEPTLNTTTQYGIFVPKFIQNFTEKNCRKGSTIIT